MKHAGVFCIVLVLMIAVTATTADARLVGWWKGDGDATDSAGGADGQLEAVSFGPGKMGQAFRFDGPSSSVRIPDNVAHDLGSRWSLAAWFYTESLSGHRPNAQGLISKVGGSHGNHGYQLGVIDGSGEVFLGFNEAGQTWPGWVLVGGKIPVRAWTHIAATYDNDTMSIYVNGALARSRTIGPKRPVNSSSNLRIGLDDNNNANVSGMIDDVRIYDHALSAAEVMALYSAASSEPPPGVEPGWDPPRTIGPVHWCLACGRAPMRRIDIGFTVPPGIGTVTVWVRNGLDDTGDDRVHVTLGDQDGRLLLDTSSGTNGWEKFSVTATGSGTYFVTLRDDDTSATGSAPGNGGSLRIELR